MEQESIIKDINNVHASRLRTELNALGLDTSGSRSDLLIRLKQAGIFNIDISKIDTSKRYENKTNVYIGNGAGLHNINDNQLFISNNADSHLIHGNFQKQYVNINNVLNIENSDFEADLEGNEGDIRRNGSNLYMYRCSNVSPGWYIFQFGSIKII